MSMKFDFKHSVEDVLNLLTDPDFLVDRNLALGDLESDCEVEEDGDDIVVRMSRQTPVELNPFLAKFFGDVQTMSMVETWTPDGDDWTGEYEIHIDGQPVTIGATFSLSAHGKGCRYEITHSCKAKIPLVGGKIEKTVLSQTEDGAREELEYAREQLG